MNVYAEENAYHLRRLMSNLKLLLLPKPKLLPPGMPQCYSISLSNYYTWNGPTGTVFIFKFPYDVAKRNKVLESLRQCGWYELNRRLEKGNDKIFLANDSDTTGWLELRFETGIEGSTCEKVQIGSEISTFEVPIYEVVCKEGAEEAIF
jgi:hypothetical protein